MDIVRETLKMIGVENIDYLLDREEIISFCKDHYNEKDFIERVYAMIILYHCNNVDEVLDKYIDYGDYTDYKILCKLTYLECLYDLKDLFENIIKNMKEYNTSINVSCSWELYNDFKRYIYRITCPDIAKYGRCMLHDE